MKGKVTQERIRQAQQFDWNGAKEHAYKNKVLIRLIIRLSLVMGFCPRGLCPERAYV